MKSFDCAVIGGGLSGLSTALYLQERGFSVALVDKKTYPSHALCGEFLSPEALPFLMDFGIKPDYFFDEALVRSSFGESSFSFPSPHASICRFGLDKKLYDLALSKGIYFILDRVESLSPKKKEGELATLHLQSGALLFAKMLFVTTSRVLKTPFVPTHTAVKARFSSSKPFSRLLMRIYPGAYFGFARVSENSYTVAGVINQVSKDPGEAFKSWHAENNLEFLDGCTPQFDEWMAATIPAFGFKQPPLWRDVYFLSDAFATIPPATGSGLFLTLASAKLAASCAARFDSIFFREEFKRRYGAMITWGLFLHRLYLQRAAGPFVPYAMRALKGVPLFVYRKTRAIASSLKDQ